MTLKSNAAAFAAGALFAVGLAISEMTKPSKVVGFLDIAGAWDPSLLLVMAGAVGVHFVTRRFILRRGSPMFDVHFHVPTRRDIDAPLVAGAALFGVGWGLAGYCPGPGLVAAASAAPTALVFVAAMTAGMWFEQAAARALARSRAHDRGDAAPSAEFR